MRSTLLSVLPARYIEKVKVKDETTTTMSKYSGNLAVTQDKAWRYSGGGQAKTLDITILGNDFE